MPVIVFVEEIKNHDIDRKQKTNKNSKAYFRNVIVANAYTLESNI